MIGGSISRTITAIITARTASAAHGTGAGITRLGIRGTSLLGDIADGMTDGTTEAGTARIIMEDITGDGTIHGTGEATGDGMTLGTVRITTHTTVAGTADGTHIGATTIITDTVRDTSVLQTIIRMYGTAQDTRQVQKEYSEAVHPSEEESAAEVR